MYRALAAALILTAAASAAEPTAPPEAPPAPEAGGGMADARARLLAADANKDGKWSKAEWLAAGRREQGFTMLDTDKDGFVTKEELKTGMEKMRAMRGAQN